MKSIVKSVNNIPTIFGQLFSIVNSIGKVRFQQ